MAKILIFDESPFMRGSLKFLAERAGHEVIGDSGDSKEAEALYRDKRPDIVTINTTGDTDWEALLKAIKAINPSLKVIIVGSAGYEDRMEQALRMGISGRINKPYVYEDIVSELKKAAEKK